MLDRDLDDAASSLRENIAGAMKNVPPDVPPPVTQKPDPAADPTPSPVLAAEATRPPFTRRDATPSAPRPFPTARAHFGHIRLLGRYTEGLAKEHGTPLIPSHQLDRTVSETLEHILSAVIGEKDTTAETKAASNDEGAKTR